MRQKANIEALVQLPVDFIGFIFYPQSPRYVGDIFEKSITDMVPQHIQKVGVFVNDSLNDVLRQAEKYKLQYIQLHGNEIPDYCNAIREKGYKVIKAFKAEPEMLTCETADYRFACDYLLFDTPNAKHGGSGQKFDWEMLKVQKLYHQFFLSGGIAPGDEEKIKALDINELYALDINSRFEIEPGLKNIQLIKEFVVKVKSL